MSATINTVKTSTYFLTNPSTQIPLTITPGGGVDVDSATAFTNAINGGGGVAWTITSLGTIASIGVQGVGINLPFAGFFSNGTAGSTAGYVNATSVGVQINGASGATATVENYGGIVTVSPNTYANAILVNTVNGVIVNTGSIVAATNGSDANGIQLNSSGVIVNKGFLVAVNGINDNGIITATASTNIANSGTIAGSGSSSGLGLDLYGGVVNNSGLIAGSSGGINGSGVNSTISLINSGTIQSTAASSGFGLQLAAANIANTGIISSAGQAISIARGVISNSGLITETTGNGPQAINLGVGSTSNTLINTGTVSAAAMSGSAVLVASSGGTIVNGQAGSNIGLISGYHTGIGFFPASGVTPGALVVANYGVILTTQAGFGAGSAFTINTSQGTTASIDNFGQIASNQTNGGGAILLAGGEVTNQVGALISSVGGDGVEASSGQLLVSNAGAIVGGSVGVLLIGGSTLTNSGTIVGQSGNAVVFDSGAGVGRLIVDPGAYFKGSVAGANGNLELAAGSGAGGALYGFGTSVTNFASLQFDSGARWTIEGNTGAFPGAITGFAAGDTIDIAGFVAATATFANNALTLTNAGGGQTSLGIQGSFSTGSFTVITGNEGGGTEITLNQAQPYTVTDPLMTNTSGSLVFDQVVGGQMVFSTIGALGSEWEFDGSGNLLGAGNPGFLIRNTGSSEPGALFVGSVVNGSASFVQVGGLGSEWQIEGSANFFGTGQSEFLIRNTGSIDTGALDLGQVVNGAVQYTSLGGLGLEWEFEGNGDFLGDGHQGFLIRNTGSTEPGTLDVGEVVNGAVNYTQIGGVGTEWKFEGTGDFLGDGHTGFLLWNSGAAELGAMAVGEVVNGSLQFTDIGAVGPEWQFIGTGNYIDSNKTDFLLRDTTTGALVVGSVNTGSASFTTVSAVGSEWNFHATNPALLA